MNAPAVVELKNVNKSFYGAKALNGMNLTIGSGEMHSLIGENGCGKSTMIKIISGFYTFDSGELYVNGKRYDKISPMEAMREGIQVIYQDFSLFSNLTIAENIVMSRFIGSEDKIMNWKQCYESARNQIAQLKVDLDPAEYVENITVAQKQLVAICRALTQDARLLIMDEPTTALTRREIETLYGIVDELLKKGISILFVSHKLDEVATISNKVTVMRNGENVFEGRTRDLTKEKMIYYMTGREISYNSFQAEIQDEEPVLKVSDFSDYENFKHINFSLYRGEVLGITGLMGCGRSEVAKALFGLIPYAGDIEINGRVTKIKDTRAAIKNRIAYVPEDRITEGLHMPRNIGENAVVCVLRQCMNKFGMMDIKKVNEKKVEILSSIKIGGMQYDKEVQQLSGGNQQKVLLVKWLATNPDILILNCPTVGVDVGSKSDIHDIIRGIAKKNVAVIVISDDIPEIMQTCSRILLMRDGEIMEEIMTRDTTSEKLEKMLIED